MINPKCFNLHDTRKKNVIDIFVAYISCKIACVLSYAGESCCNKKTCNIFSKIVYKYKYDWGKMFWTKKYLTFSPNLTRI